MLLSLCKLDNAFVPKHAELLMWLSTFLSCQEASIECDGLLQVRASRVGSDTALSQIVRLVETAQLSKAPIQAFADYVSSIFVPIVVCLAFVTWLSW